MTSDSSEHLLPAIAPELPPDEAARPREHFIPLRKAEMVRVLAEESGLSLQERQQFLELCQLVGSTIHFHYHQMLEELKEAYASVDPDVDERSRGPQTQEQMTLQADIVFEKFGALMERANFHKLTRDQIHSALDSASHWGLNLQVDFNIFERLDVYARGDVLGERMVKIWRNFYREVTIDVPTYQRLAVVFRLKDDSAARPREAAGSPHRPLVMKLFKNIPKADLEMLLPGTRVRMSLFDQGKIWLPTLSGIGLALFKIVKGAALLAFASIYGLLAFLAILIGTIGYGVKAFLGYLNTKDKYQLSLTRSLYFQNLDNNAGVFFRLLDEAEEQEFHEAVLAWWVLWRRGREDDGGWTSPQIDRAAEGLLREKFGIKVDFEIEDALDKLRKLKLIEALPGERWRAVEIKSALVNLDRAWDSFFTYHEASRAQSRKHLLRMLQAA